MDIIKSIDEQIEWLKAMRAHVVAEKTRQFDEAQIPLPIANDWIEWAGGFTPPVTVETVVEIRRRDGLYPSPMKAWFCRWEHKKRGSDIIAYRIAGERT